MACYSPLKGFYVGLTDKGKKKLKVTSYDVEYLHEDPFSKSSALIPCYSAPKPFMYDTYGYYTDFVEIPCGQCIGCRLEYSRQWAIRCMLESEYHTSNYFMTLTYAPDCKIMPELVVDSEQGKHLSLRKKHLSAFVKRLRQALFRRDLPSFRFFACGEYGERKGRPHYHMIAFGLVLDDLEPAPTSWSCQSEYPLYTSKLVSDNWQHGNVVIGECTFESCAYVSRYITKKQKCKKGDVSVYEQFNIEPEFSNMSRRPGIGAWYFGDNFDSVYRYDRIVLDGGRTVRPPRYFDKLMSDIDEILMESIKEKRQFIAETSNEFKLRNTSNDYLSMLECAERNQESRLKKLVRVYEIDNSL